MKKEKYDNYIYSINMPESTTLPIKLDFQDIRKLTQTINNNIVFECIKNKNKSALLENINKNELDRVLDETGLTLDQLIEEASENNTMNKILSGRISKKSSRQGTKLENLQLVICNTTAEQCNSKITNLSATALRPTKTGLIVSQKEMKEKNIEKHECLKSFDGQISGNINGYIFAKVVFGSGGHQDNVFEEADTLCNWVKTYKNNNSELFVILIDTDLKDKFENLKLKYNEVKNILITDHFDFQKYIIDKHNQTEVNLTNENTD